MSELSRINTLRLAGNPQMSCRSLELVLNQLGCPPVDVDGNVNTVDSINPGANCM
ncbi:MAG TPA: hypothetical protein VIM41_08270 [Gammaproteobacteria bacterium]